VAPLNDPVLVDDRSAAWSAAPPFAANSDAAVPAFETTDRVPKTQNHRRPARQPDKMWRIGYLTTQNYPNDLSKSFVGGLSARGYVEGKNLIVEGRAAEGKNQRLPALATTLIDTGVDVIVTEGTPATKAAMKSTTTVPIVFGSAQDPVEKGIVKSLSLRAAM
jgi:hypothetical protein